MNRRIVITLVVILLTICVAGAAQSQGWNYSNRKMFVEGVKHVLSELLKIALKDDKYRTPNPLAERLIEEQASLIIKALRDQGNYSAAELEVKDCWDSMDNWIDCYSVRAESVLETIGRYQELQKGPQVSARCILIGARLIRVKLPTGRLALSCRVDYTRMPPL